MRPVGGMGSGSQGEKQAVIDYLSAGGKKERRQIMCNKNTLNKSTVLVVLFLAAALSAGFIYADKPIVTDEFDRFLVTEDTKIGDVLGKIELVFENPLKTTWSLMKPQPGGDRRNYLKEGQLDATDIVEINADTGELRLKARPHKIPANYYAEVRATNRDGSMEQVLIIIALAETPKLENALDIFTQRAEGGGIGFYATETVDPKKVEYAAKVARALLAKDRSRTGKVSEYVKERNAVMTIFKSFEERNTAIGFYMHHRSLGINTQDLEDEEIIPDYLRLGGPRDLRRDASVEEITHLIHGGGIKRAYPGVQERLERATKEAIKRNFYQPQDGLPADSFSDEYLAFGLDIYYGVRSHRSYNGMPLTPENLKTIDPELYDILSFLFPTREEFFKEMGWEADLDRAASARYDKYNIVFVKEVDGNSELFLARKSSGDIVRLTNTSSREESYPTWSADGRLIVYVGGDEKNPGIYAMDIETGSAKMIVPGFDDAIPSVSPDGKQIVLTDAASKSIVIVDIASGKKTPVPHAAERGAYATWSKSGPHLVFEGPGGIFRTDIDGKNTKRLTSNAGLNEWPRFSPDGTMIAYAAGSEEEKHLWVVNADGTGARQLSKGIHFGDAYPAWSPDGTTILFAAHTDDKTGIYEINVKDKSTKYVMDGMMPDWRQ